jgi:hypothetical protein
MRTFLIILFVFIATTSIAQIGTKPERGNGYYINSSGEKIAGSIEIQVHDDYLFYKAANKNFYDRVKIDQIQSVVVNDAGHRLDSLVVLTEDAKDSKKYFAKPVVASKTTNFYVKAKFNHWGTSDNPNIATAGQGTGPFRSNDIIVRMYSDNGTTHELTRSNYKDILSKAFADYPALSQQIIDGYYKFREIDDIFDQYIKYLSLKK